MCRIHVSLGAKVLLLDDKLLPECTSMLILEILLDVDLEQILVTKKQLVHRVEVLLGLPEKDPQN